MNKHKRNFCVALLGLASFALALWFAVLPGRTVAAATEGSISGKW